MSGPAVVAFVWNNFGPLHDDRMRATVERLAGKAEVLGIEMAGRSDVYSWIVETAPGYRKTTIFPGRRTDRLPALSLAARTIGTLLRQRAGHVFLCHYEQPQSLIVALIMRALGRRVFVMGCAKFDDRDRSAAMEFLKQVFLLPYQGLLYGSPRTRAFFAFRGMRSRPMRPGYNTVSTARIRALAGEARPTFEDRDFVAVSRLVPKKNLATLLRAFALYRERHPDSRRRLRLCGDGPLEGELRALAQGLSLDSAVLFDGFVQTGGLAPILAGAAALVLVSTEEQFGNVVPEALAVGTPVILSDACGARDELLETGVNGFLVEPHNIEGIADALARVVESPERWRAMSEAALRRAPLGDASRFADGVAALMAGDAR